MADIHSKLGTTIYKITRPERYCRVGYRPMKGEQPTPAINLKGRWLSDAGFTPGQPLKLRIMPGCMIITIQDLREVWHCLEGLSLEDFDEQATANWLARFPGGLDLGEFSR